MACFVRSMSYSSSDIAPMSCGFTRNNDGIQMARRHDMITSPRDKYAVVLGHAKCGCPKPLACLCWVYGTAGLWGHVVDHLCWYVLDCASRLDGFQDCRRFVARGKNPAAWIQAQVHKLSEHGAQPEHLPIPTPIPIRIHMHTNIQIQIHIHVYMYTYTYTYVYVHIHRDTERERERE